MDMILTQEAKKQLDKIQADGKYLRIMLSKSGCCSYGLEFYADVKKQGDTLFEVDGYGFLVTEREKVLLPAVQKIDYGRKGIFRDFKAVMR